MKKILVPDRNCRGIYGVQRSGLLVDGRNYYRAFYNAAREASRYILIAGWQFERSVPLLRGDDAKNAADDVRLARFLDGLCERNERLRIFILMWDFSPVVAFNKEWFNKWILDLTASERINFRFDDRHALYASHHQKLVVIDGTAAFVGGLDFCANSWDDRKHWEQNAERVLAGEEYEPYHDIQSFNSGPVAWELTKLFQQRWVQSGGADLGLEPPEDPEKQWDIPELIPVKTNRMAVSMTRAQTLLPVIEPLMDIRQLYIDAIEAADKLIYIESQYFTSQAVYEALKQRLIDRNRPCPQIVLILPKRMHTLVEDISLSVVQAKMLRSLTKIAAERRRAFGVYYTAAALRSGGPEKATYIHSKLLLVDDRFLSIGSANVTNRSMGMDTELNVSWEAESADEFDLMRSMRRVRANLLMEHAGLRRLSQRRTLNSIEGLVDYLNDNADRVGCRLRRHTMESFLEDVSWIRDLVPEDLSIDPERPVIEESIYEMISRDRNSIFAKGLLFLNELVQAEMSAEGRAGQGGQLTAAIAEKKNFGRSLGNRGRFRWFIVAAVALAIAATIWLLFGS